VKDERYKQIMENLGQTNSLSLYQALKQVANEVGHEYETKYHLVPKEPKDPIDTPIPDAGANAIIQGVDFGAFDASASFQFYAQAPEEILRLSKEGFFYKGELIADAGVAHEIWLEVMKKMSSTTTNAKELIEIRAMVEPTEGETTAEAVARVLEELREDAFKYRDLCR